MRTTQIVYEVIGFEGTFAILAKITLPQPGVGY